MSTTPDIEAVVERLTLLAAGLPRLKDASLPALVPANYDPFAADLRLLIADHARVREALTWISLFAEMRSQDDSKTFARVNRGALRTISERSAQALGGSHG